MVISNCVIRKVLKLEKHQRQIKDKIILKRVINQITREIKEIKTSPRIIFLKKSTADSSIEYSLWKDNIDTNNRRKQQQLGAKQLKKVESFP